VIVFSLIIHFWRQTSTQEIAWKNIFLAALFFCWIGDILLLGESDLYFMLGLGAFLLGHIGYSWTYYVEQKQRNQNIKWQWLPLILMFCYTLFLTIQLHPYLGDLQIPVYVYICTIFIMTLFAIHRRMITNKRSYLMVLIGVLFFVLSDSAIAWSKFKASFDSAPYLIMSTYMIGQFLIVQGMLASKK